MSEEIVVYIRPIFYRRSCIVTMVFDLHVLCKSVHDEILLLPNHTFHREGTRRDVTRLHSLFVCNSYISFPPLLLLVILIKT